MFLTHLSSSTFFSLNLSFSPCVSMSGRLAFPNSTHLNTPMLKNQIWLFVVHQIKYSHVSQALYFSMVSLSTSTPFHSHIFTLFHTFQGLFHFLSLSPHLHRECISIYFAPSSSVSQPWYQNFCCLERF